MALPNAAPISLQNLYRRRITSTAGRTPPTLCTHGCSHAIRAANFDNSYAILAVTGGLALLNCNLCCRTSMSTQCTTRLKNVLPLLDGTMLMVAF